MKSSVLRWGAVVAWAALIFTMSSIRGSSLPGGYSIQAHFTEYFILAVLLYIALRPGRSALAAALLALALASLYGASDEFHQSFVPLRTPDPVDWMTDTAGAATGVLVAWLVDRWRTARG